VEDEMTKTALVEKVARATGLSNAKADAAVNAVIEAIATEMESGREGKVTLPGFGTFKRSHRAAREAHNPATGGKVSVPAKNVVKFSAGKTLADRVAGT
jgi:DNA-binding protein HU-beta